MQKNENEVWLKVGEAGFRRHSSNIYVVIKRYKRKTGFGIFEKILSGRYWNSRKLGEFEDIDEVIRFLTNYKEGTWRVSKEELIKALEEKGWYEEKELSEDEEEAILEEVEGEPGIEVFYEQPGADEVAEKLDSEMDYQLT